MSRRRSLKNKKILITGGYGFLGSHVIEELVSRGVPRRNISAPRSSELDLRIPRNCTTAMQGIELVIHCAATVGGIAYNKAHPGTLFFDNVAMGLHLLEAARNEGVEKFVMIGSICEYPHHAPLPFREKKPVERIS